LRDAGLHRPDDVDDAADVGDADADDVVHHLGELVIQPASSSVMT
jgi:hypothetical protein